jgi:UPF0755 protein
MDFWLNLKKKAAVLFERDSSRIRLIAWRDRVAKVLLFLDNHIFRIVSAVFLLLVLFGAFYFFSWRSPKPFPEQALVTVERGESLSQIANSFEQKGIIRSGFWLKAFIVILGGEKRVIAGDYYFPTATNLFRVAKMIHKGEFGLIAKKTTIPEGTCSYEIAKILEKELPAFNAKDFTKEVSDNNYEGYLFPDTYFFMPNTKAGDVILMMRENFTRQINQYEGDIAKFKKPFSEIINMASIIEEESNGNLEAKRIVSGILWKRLRLGMPLQVDAPFQYYNGKNSYTLTKEDLTENHPYNTYINKGLPPTAITNPGIDSIRAAITPTQTEYLYFLSDKKGGMHYAKNFDEHKRNRELYLN